MTTVLARLTVPSSGAAASGWVPAHEAPSRGHLDCCPYAPAGARRHEESPDRIVLPAAFVAKLVDGEATLQLAPTAAWWCWQIIERTARGATRYVAVPESLSTLDYADLVDVDPTTLAATAEPEAAWWTALEAAQLGVQATVDPDDPDVLILTMQSWQLDPADPLAIILLIGA